MRPKHPGPTVLLVDDEADFLEATAHVLERRGMTVLTASRGEAALQCLATEPVDVAVLDEKMPGMSGEELFERMRHRWPLLPVIVLTGHGSIPQAFRMSKAGIVDYLVKPADLDRLEGKIRQAAKARAQSNPAPTPQGSTAPSVLLVDDDPELLASLLPVLARRGLQVASAGSADMALALMRQQPVDVLVLDVKLPGTDGLELLRRIKAEDPTVEVILLTGYPSVRDAVRGLGLGAVDYLGKPPDIGALLEAIRAAHQRRGASIEAARRSAVKEALERFPG
jgi:DNA-binding NtrC family response regulator